MDSINPNLCIASILGRLDYWVDVPSVSYVSGRVQTVPDVFPVRIKFEDSGFFRSDRLHAPNAPCPPEKLLQAASPEGFAQMVETVGEGHVIVHFDLPACAWWFLSRHEEVHIDKRDEHGRFLCGYSTLPPELYDQPLVTRWFERVEDLVRQLSGLSPLPPRSGAAPIALTHDIDLLRKFPMLRPRALARACRERRLFECLGVWLRQRRDPYDSLDKLVSLHEELGVPATWFLMGGGTSPNDGDYTMNDRRLSPLGKRLDCDSFGLHASYDSYLDAKTIYDEAVKVGVAFKMRFTPLIRQHYLRFDIPRTWEAQAQAGFVLDATAGFADRCGFRHGWTGIFTPYNPLTGREMPIQAVPLNAMDMTLSNYEKLMPADALERLKALHKEAGSRHGGLFVVLWHNTLNDRRVHGEMWSAFESFTRNTTARFVALDAI